MRSLQLRFASFMRCAIALAAGLLLARVARAQPAGGQVVAGEASISAGDRTTTITAGHNSILTWTSFDLPQGDLVQFIQPGADARVLNWIGGTAPSQIDGTLRANGQVYLMNTAGIYFGSTAVVDTGALYAVGGSMSKEDFFAGINRFTGLTGDVHNAGTLRGDTIALVGRSIVNTGRILAPDGFVGLAAGDSVFLQGDGSRIRVEAGRSAAAGEASMTGVANRGEISAGKGTVVLAAGDLFAVAITHEGRLSARDVRLEGQGRGRIAVAGRIDASADKGKGGTIAITGERVDLAATATLDASGAAGGGTILVGGDYLGGNPNVRNAQVTTVAKGASLRADATAAGDGGRIIVWADGVTRFAGSLFARGGPGGGDGGFAEVSGKGLLDFVGTVDLLAPLGRGGSLLLDPTNIVIRAADPDLEGDGGGLDLTAAGIAAVDFGDVTSIITAGQLSSLLQSTGSISLAATNDIGVEAAVSWSSDHALTLDAGRDINIGAAITHTGSAGGVTLTAGGTVALSADVTSTGGSLAFNGPVVPSGARTIAGAAVTFAGSIDGSAASTSLDLSSNGSLELPDTTVAGTLTVAATDLTLAGNVSAGSASLHVGDGTLTVNTGRTLTVSGNSLLEMADLALAGNIQAGGAVLDLRAGGDRSIGLGATAVAGGLNISSSELARIGSSSLLRLTTTGAGGFTVDGIALPDTAGVTGTLALGAIGSGAISFVNTASSFTGALTLSGSGGTSLGASVSAGGAMSIDGTVTTSGSPVLTATGGLTLSGAGDIGSSGARLAVSAPTVSLNKTSGADIYLRSERTGGVTLSGTAAGGTAIIDVLSRNADNSADAALTIDGSALTATGTGSSVTFGAAALTLTGGITSPTIALTNSGNLTGAGSLSASTSLSLAGGGSVGASDGLLATTTPSLTVGKSSGSVFLANTGALNLSGSSGGDLNISATGALNLSSTLNASGQTVRLVAAGGITQAGGAVLTAGGLSARNAGSGNISLSQSNDIGTLAAHNAVSGGTITLRSDRTAGLTIGSVGAAGASFVATAGVTSTNADITINNGAGTVFINQDILSTGSGNGTEILSGFIAAHGVRVRANSDRTITVAGNSPDSVFQGEFEFGATSVSATRDIIFNGAFTASSTSSLSLIADSDNNGTGGVLITGSGSLLASSLTSDLTIAGSSIVNAGHVGGVGLGVGQIFHIAAGGRVEAAQGITVSPGAAAPPGAGIAIYGNGTAPALRALSGGISLTPTSTGSTLLGGSALTETLLSATGAVSFGGRPVALSGASRIVAPTTTFASPVDGAGALSLSGAGVFADGVGVGTALTSLTVDGTSSFAGDVFANGLTFTGAVSLGSATGQSLSAGTGTLSASSTITKTGAGDLTLSGATLVSLGGAVTAPAALVIDGPASLAADVTAATSVTFSGGVARSGGVVTAQDLVLQGNGHVGASALAQRLTTNVSTVTLAKTGGVQVYLLNRNNGGVSVGGTAAGAGAAVDLWSRNGADSADAPLTTALAGLSAGGAGSTLRLWGSTLTFDGALTASTIALGNSNTLGAGTFNATTLAFENSGPVGSAFLPLSTANAQLQFNKSGGGDVYVDNRYDGGVTLTGQTTEAGSILQVRSFDSLGLFSAPISVGAGGLINSGAGSSVSLRGTSVDIAGALTSPSLALDHSGALTPTDTLTATTQLTLAGTGQVGSVGSPLAIATPSLVLNKVAGDVYVSNGSNTLQLTPTLFTGGGSFTAGDLTLNGSINAGTNALTFTTQAFALGAHTITAAEVTFANSGLLSANGGYVWTNRLTLNGSGNVGGAGSRFLAFTPEVQLAKTGGADVHLLVQSLSPVTISGTLSGAGGLLDIVVRDWFGGDQDYEIGSANLVASDAAVITVVGRAATIAGDLYATAPGSEVALTATAVTLSGDISGDQVTVTHSGAMSGSGVLRAATQLTLAGTGTAGSAGSFQTIDTPLLVLNKSAGNVFANNGANALQLTPTAFTGRGEFISGAFTLLGPLNVGANAFSVTASSVDLGSHALTGGNVTFNHSGALSGSGLVTASQLNLLGNGAAGTSGARLSIAASTLLLDKSGGNTFVAATGGLGLRGTTAADLDLTGTGAVTNPAALTVAGLLAIDAGTSNVTLDFATNDFATVTAQGGTITLRDVNALTLGAVDASGNLVVTAGGALTGLDAITVSGTSQLNTSSSITLTNATNSFADLIGFGLNPTSLTLVADGAVLLGGMTVGGGSGALQVSAGSIAQTGGIVAGLTVLDAGSGAITLEHAANVFDDLTLTGGTVRLREAGAITDGAAWATGSTTLDAGGHAITLDAAGSSTGALHLTGGAVMVARTAALELGAVNAGTLTLTSAGGIAGSGVVQAGATTLDAGTAGVALTNGGNVIGDLTIAGGAVTIIENDAITDGGAWATGETTLNAGIHAIALDDAASSTGLLNLTGGAVSVSRDAALVLGAVDAATLSLTSGNGISGTVAIQTGATELDAGSAAISLTNAGNVFGDLTVRGGSVAIVENDAITDGGAWATGETILNAGTHAITLDAVGSTSGLLNLTGGAVSVSRDAAITLGGVSASTLSLTSSNGISGTVAIQTGETLLDAGNAAIVLTNAGNVFGDLTVRGGTVAITENDAITDGGAWTTGDTTLDVGAHAIVLDHVDNRLGDLTLTGGAVAIAENDAITDGGVWSVGETTLNAGAHAIVLDAAGSTTGLLNLTGGAVNVSRDAAIVLGAVNASTLSLTSSNGISGTVAIQTGETHLDAGNAAIVLTNAGNVFGDLTVRGGAVAITENDTITDGGAWTTGETTLEAGPHAIVLDHAGNRLGDLTVRGGAVTITENDVITDGGAWTTGETTLNAGGQAIVLDAAGTTTGLLSLTGGAVSISRDAAIVLGAVNASTLSLTSSNGISGTVAIQTGETQLDAGSAAISLTNAGNIFGDLTVRGGAVAITENDTITDGGAWAVGETTLNAGAHAIVLDAAGSTTGLLNLTGGGVSVSRDTAIVLGAVNASTLSLTSSNGISGTVAIQTGETQLDAGSAAIVLTHAGNVFGDLTVRGGAVAIAENDTITDGGAWTTGETTLNAGAHAIVLDAAGSTTGLLNLTGGAVNVSRDAAITLGAVNASTLALTSSSGISGTVAIQTGATLLDAGGAAISLTNAANVFGDLTVRGGAVAITENDAITDGGGWVTGETTLDAGSHAIVLDAAGSTTGLLHLTGGAVTISRDAAVVLGAINTGTLSVTSAGGITGTQAIQTGATQLDAGSAAISLTNTGNVFGDLTVRGGTVAITENDAITDGGAWATGETTLHAGAHAIVLDAPGSVTGVLNLTAGSVLVSRAAAIELGTLNTSSLSLASRSGIIGTRAIQTGATTLDAGDGMIALTNSANVFGDLTVTGGTVAITENDAITDGGAWRTGATTLDAGGHAIVLDNPGNRLGDLALRAGSVALTEDDPITQAGAWTTGATVLDAGGFAITLEHPENVFGALTFRGREVSIAERDTITLAGVNRAALLSLKSAGGISSLGGTSLEVTGEAILDATDSDIALGGDGTDEFNFGSLRLAGRTIDVTERSSMLVEASASGALTLRAAGVTLAGVEASELLVVSDGDITATLPSLVAGTANFDAGEHAIVLDQVENDFGRVALRGGSIALVDRNNLEVDTLRSSPGGEVDIRAGGAMTLLAPLTVSGRYVFDADALLQTDAAIDGDGDGAALLLSSRGAIRLGGPIGVNEALAELTVDAGEGILLDAGHIRTSTTLTLGGPVTLLRDTTFVARDVQWRDGAVAATDGGQSLALQVSGSAQINGPLGTSGARLRSLESSGAGRLVFRGGAVETTGDQTYGTEVVLAATTSFRAGNVFFGEGVNSATAAAAGAVNAASGPGDLFVSASGTTTFAGPVGQGARLGHVKTDTVGRTLILDRFSATSAEFGNSVTFEGGARRIETTGTQTYGEAVELQGDLEMVSTEQDLTLRRGMSGAGRAVQLSAPRGLITVAGDLGSSNARFRSVFADGRDLVVHNIYTTEDIRLAIGTEAGSTGGVPNAFLQLTGSTLDAEGGAIVLGSGALTPDQAGDDKTGAPLRSSIFKSNGGDLLLTGRNVTIQPFERLSVRDGSLILFADERITLSNTAVSQTLALIAPQIQLWSRGAQPVVTVDRGAGEDRGTEIVGARVLFYRGGVPGAPTRADVGTFDFAASQGNMLSNAPEVVTVVGTGGQAPQIVFVADLAEEKTVLRPLIANVVYLDLRTAAGLHDAPVVPPIRFGNEGETPVFSLVAAGQLRASLEQAFLPVLPRQAQATAVNEATLAPAVREQLQALGIYARALTPEERQARDRRAGLFVVVPARERPRESDYEVVDARVEESSVREVLRLAEASGLVGESDTLAEVAEALARVYEVYQTESSADDGARFRQWLEARTDSDARRVQRFAESVAAMLRQIELLGLTRQELDISKAQIYGSILMPRLNADPDFLRAMIEGAPRSGWALAAAASAPNET